MSKTLIIDDLELGIAPDCVREDLLWQRCLSLAFKSRSEDQRYGALVVVNGQVVGEGWNRLLKKGEPFPFKTTFFLHAERAAIGDAMRFLGTEEISGATVHVAGFLVRERRPLIRRSSMIDKGTCTQCARLYVRHGLSVALMSQDGWVELKGEKALLNALENASILRARGIGRRQFRTEICL